METTDLLPLFFLNWMWKIKDIRKYPIMELQGLDLLSKKNNFHWLFCYWSNFTTKLCFFFRCRKKDVSLFLTGLHNEGRVNTMAILLQHLQTSLPNQRPLAAVLLFYLDILVYRNFLKIFILKFSIYLDSMPHYYTFSLHQQCHLQTLTRLIW